MTESFRYDVFLAYAEPDEAKVRELAERLQGDGLRVWFDEWAIRPGDSIPRKIEEGQEHSAKILLCMSQHALDCDLQKSYSP